MIKKIENKRKKSKPFIGLLLIITLLIPLISLSYVSAAEKLTVKNSSGKNLSNGAVVTDNKVHLTFGKENRYYKATITYDDKEKIAQQDYEDLKGLKVLEICPSDGVEYLSKWFEMDVKRERKKDEYPLKRNKYNVDKNGKATLQGSKKTEGIFDIYYCTMTEFNSAYDNILKKDSDRINGWNYDIVCFGFNDANATQTGQDSVDSIYGEVRAKWLSSDAQKKVKEYINSGAGIVFGHDTIVNNYVARGSYTDVMINDPNKNYFRGLASLCGMKLDESDSPRMSTSITKQKTGLLTTYPFSFNEYDAISVVDTHSLGQVATRADVWYELKNTGTPYLMTYNNTAFTQAGHTAQMSMTKTEKELLANTVFYVNQFLLQEDSSVPVPDMDKPDVPDIASNGNFQYEFTSDDNGTDYIIKGYMWKKNSATDANRGDVSTADEKTNSVSIISKTGVKKYYYIVDTSKNTVITPQTSGVKSISGETATYDASGVDLSSKKYIHVIAVDGRGNYSDTSTVQLESLYYIQYHGNGGETSDGKTSYKQTVTYNEYPFKLKKNSFEKDGYEFKGWKTSEDATEITYENRADINKNLANVGETYHLYAHWEKSPGKVQYHRNGSDVTSKGTYTLVDDLAGNSNGEVLKKTIKVTDTTADLHNVTSLFARTGYHAVDGKEWLIGNTGLTVSHDDNTSMTDVFKQIELSSDRLVTLYANWEPNTYTIRFHGNGATSGSMADMLMKYNEQKNLTANAFIRDGHIFDGWTTNADGTGDYYKDKQEVKNLTSTNGGVINLYAKWKAKTLKIVYKPNGGTGSDVEANYTYNESITVLSNQWFSKQFYHFTGWNTSADGRGDAYNPNTAIDWNTISFDKNGQATLILYAQWLPNTFTIRYEPNGGNESPITESYTYNKNITTASNTIFTRKGYYYDFWNTNSDGNGADYAPNTNIPWSFLSYDVNGHASMTLYAKWKPNIYTIRFHPNGGEGHMDDIKPVSYDTSVELPKCSYTKENEYGPSSFKGWNIVGDTKDYIFDDKATVKNVTELLGLENEKDVVVTLYAIWDDCPGIKSKDLYYTLEQAQSGYITEDELLNQAKAFDLEDNEIAPGTHENNSFRVMDYQESDFTKFEHSGSVTETYKVIDSYGNSYKEQITVYIVDTTPDPIQTNSDNTEKEGTTRFIDEKYYRLPYEQGGLQSNSIWLVDVDYRKSIENAFDNIKNSTPEALYEFSHGEILEMKEFVKMKGIGNTKEDSALQQFYNNFF